MYTRARILIAVEADLDAVPGWGHQAVDWFNLVARQFALQSHYNTSCELLSIEEKPMIFVEDKGWVAPLFSDHPDYIVEA